MAWTVERSEDRKIWIPAVSFHTAALAEAAFDLELAMRKTKYIRLVSPDGAVHERASLLNLPTEKS